MLYNHNAIIIFIFVANGNPRVVLFQFWYSLSDFQTISSIVHCFVDVCTQPRSPSTFTSKSQNLSFNFQVSTCRSLPTQATRALSRLLPMGNVSRLYFGRRKSQHYCLSVIEAVIIYNFFSEWIVCQSSNSGYIGV